MVKTLKHAIKTVILFLLPAITLSQSAATGDSYCETLNKIIKLYKEGKYTALYKADTEKKADESFLYNLEYEAAYPIKLFGKSFVLKATDLKPFVYSVRFAYEGDVGDATEIFNTLKGCFEGWAMKEESDYYEEALDMIEVYTYTYTKEGIKVRFYITESIWYSEAELKIDRE